MKWFSLAIVLIIWIVGSSPVLAKASLEAGTQVKELNFVFLHGAGGNSGALQRLSDHVLDGIPNYIREYEAANPGIKLNIGTLNRCYPNDVDIDTWAKNVVDSITRYFNKDNLILIGHSMGGKTALYATANNIGGIADKVRAVVTINSPIKHFSQYYFTGGVNYWRAAFLLSQSQGVLSGGVLNSIAYYDSTVDGRKVGTDNHWLAFVSGESSPSSELFDFGGVDPLPRDMDDTIVPIQAQYSEGADVVYYGEHAHSDFSDSDQLAGTLADNILCYVFGKRIEVSVPARSGTFDHEAGWMPVVEKWENSYGSTAVNSGKIMHQNESYFKWQDWEDVVGEGAGADIRDSYQLRQDSMPVLTGIVESRWQSGNTEDCWVYIKTRAAPRSTVQVEWSVARNPLLSSDFPRDRFEVEITSGTPFTGIERVTWLNENSLDQMMNINSYAEGPYRWFKAQWRTYARVPRMRNIISEFR
jgi:pimeloyl-ACP methyl ester carboxylesterase